MASKPTRRQYSAKSSRRLRKPQESCHRSASSISDKLEALKSLIPSDTDEIKPDQLYEETANYIVLLKTQVFVLQKLIDFSGSQSHSNPNAV
ncbi:transcription factor UPBEAT1-like [Salvia hispanica]|uniref:transcription factor UPBEAT1-like n=1 Tax=Salvia hispanica TaxID=49212 RepID=UPI002009B4F5|nr:transcription factor UPBEAT1-like [Salvia hispanica]